MTVNDFCELIWSNNWMKMVDFRVRMREEGNSF